jgi:hypothetical protein
MIVQRFVGDEGSMQGRLTIENAAGDANGYAELVSLGEELKLRANIRTEGPIITRPPVEDTPPIPTE